MTAITDLYRMNLHSGRLTKPRWSPNGRLLALGTEHGSISIFDIERGQVAQSLGPHNGAVTSVCWDRASELVMSGSLDGSIGVWEVKSGKSAPFSVEGHGKPVHSVDWTDEGAYAMTCSVDRLRAWDGFCLQAGWTQEMEDLANRNTGFTAAACSYQTTFLLSMAAENGLLLLLMGLVSAELLDSRRVNDPVRCLTWSPKEDLLAVGGSHSILTFRTTQAGFEEAARELAIDVPHVHALAFSGNGALLGSSDDEGLKIWDVESGKLIAALSESENIEILSTNRVPAGIAFHPTKPVLVTIAPNGNEFRILDLSQLA
jgi:WD40 repeat protein